MPMVRIELYPGRTPEQKTACARDVVAALSKHLNASAEATQVVFVEVAKEDWLLGSRLVAGQGLGAD